MENGVKEKEIEVVVLLAFSQFLNLKLKKFYLQM